MKTKKKPENYVNNAEFYENLVKFKDECALALAQDKPKPRVPEKIGLAIVQISNRLSTRYNFQNYTFREEMVGDGIVNGLEAVKNFNPEKSANPFAYFTQIIFRAFIRRIEKEKNERNVRDAMMFDVTSDLYEGEDGFGQVNTDELFLLMKS